MKRIVLMATVALVMAAMMAVAGPAFAHDAGPCAQTADSGHSEFAKHHVVFQAHQGTLGAGGHVPGAHQGFSICN